MDDKQRALRLSDNVGRYLLLSGGPSSGDVAALVRPKLRFEMRSALHRAFDQHWSTLSLPVRLQLDGEIRPVQIQVRSLLEGSEWRHTLLA